MAAAFYDDDGNHVKECTKCAVVQPIDQYYKYEHGGATDGRQQRCGLCILAGYREKNAKRAKKRKQRTHKLSPIHVEWIREQKDKLSTRETAKAFSKRFHDMKINNATVHRIFTGEFHPTPEQQSERRKKDTVSIYDVLQGAQDLSGSVEDYVETLANKKIKY